jgi:L-ascorbate metabolism protein UlaG (beta-lactamase superfamily)
MNLLRTFQSCAARSRAAHCILFVCCVVAAVAGRGTAAPAGDVFRARGGNIRITPIFHGTLQIEYRGKVIIVDPFSPGSYRKKADLVLITHAHPDHLDRDAILKVSTPRTVVVMPTLVAGQFHTWRNVVPMDNGEVYDARRPLAGESVRSSIPNLTLQAVPMYNMVRGPKPGQKFHPKGDGNGYVLTLGGKRIYIAGDTEAVPEMKALKKIDIAFLPMNLPFTMTPQEAATGARAFKPRVVYPYHYRYPFNKANNHPQQFQAALRNTDIEVRLRTWYPAAAVQRATQAAKG